MSLTVQAPDGAHFAFDEVKTQKGAASLGDVPILVWDSVDKMVEFYTNEGVLAIADGTSVRVSMQSIARRLKAAGKTDDEIATKQLEFRPGKRVVGESTPVSRAKSAASRAAEKVSGDVIAALLKKIETGEITEEDAAAMAGVTL